MMEGIGRINKVSSFSSKAVLHHTDKQVALTLHVIYVITVLLFCCFVGFSFGTYYLL